MLETFNYAYEDVIAAIDVSIALNDAFNYIPAEGNIIREDDRYYFDMEIDLSANPGEDAPEIEIQRIPMNVNINDQRMLAVLNKAIKYPQHCYKTVFYKNGIPGVSLIFHKGSEDFALRLQEEEVALEYFRFIGVDTEEDLDRFMQNTKKDALSRGKRKRK